jgi:hypothetical protein
MSYEINFAETTTKEKLERRQRVTLIVHKQDYLRFMCSTLNASYRHHLIIYSRSQIDKNNKNYYPIDDAEIVGDDMSVSKLAHVVAMLTGSGLKFAQS